MNKSAKHITIASPIDLYGLNARKLHLALSRLGTVLTIEKPEEKRACPASSLLGILKLGVKKGDTIRLVANETGDNLDQAVSVFHRIAC